MGIKLIFKRIKSELMYRKAVCAADKAAKKSGEVHFVLPMESGRLIATNRKHFEAFKRMKLADKSVKTKDLFKDCVYHTNCRSRNGRRSKKRKFLKWKGLI